MDRSPEWHAERRTYVGGSDANIILSGDEDKITDLWRFKTGQTEAEDLSWSLPVQIGIVTEDLNVAFFEHRTGYSVTDRHRAYRFGSTIMRAEVDGIVPAYPAIFEAKHISSFRDIDEAVQGYMPQLHHNMLCSGHTRAELSIFHGTTRHEVFSVEFDEAYGWHVVDSVLAFWHCVETGFPPFLAQHKEPPKPVDKTVRVDMKGDNEWGASAADWLANRSAAKTFDVAEKALKKLVPEGAGAAYGSGIVASRNAKGAISIKESEA